MRHVDRVRPVGDLRSRAVLTSLAALALCVGASACGSTKKAASTTTASTAAGGGAGSATTAATSGKSAAPVKVCTTLPTSQAASLSGKPLSYSREQDFAADNSYTCAYFPASKFGGINVTVSTADGATKYQNTLQVDKASASAEHPTTVSGIGDKAFSARDGLHVLFGDRLITVAGLTSVAPAEAIVQALQAKLP